MFGDIICFQVPGVDVRKVQPHRTKPGPVAAGGEVEVCYRGPLAEVETDGGVVFRRGIPVRVPVDLWGRLKDGPAGNQFVAAGSDAAAAAGDISAADFLPGERRRVAS